MNQSRRQFLQNSAVTLGLFGVFLRCSRPKFQKPNFLFILIDDLGWADVSCYGRKKWHTPNIDRLASEGMKFTDAYAACPVCSPTRASIMSGKYPARLWLTDWIPGGFSWYKNPKLIVPDFRQHLPLEEMTLAEALKQAGYATASIGKWHLGEEPYFPSKQGFEKEFIVSKGNVGSYFGYDKTGKRDRKHSETQKPIHLTRLLTEKAEKWLDENHEDAFFLYFSTHIVHTPIQAREKVVQQYLNKGLRATGTESATYAAMVDHADESVGRLLKKLKEHQITDRTVVIFMSDNGGRIPQTSNAPLSGSKGELLEGGIRVPMLIKWPRVIKPGRVCRVPVTSTDFYPTLLDMAGLLLKPNQHMDGKSLVPLCKGKTSIEREAIFWHYPHYNGQPKGKPSSAVRKGNWKLIEFFEDNHLELYNLKQDIGEKNNLVHKHPDKADELHQQLENWRKKVNAQMPKPNPNYDPNQESGWPKERIRSMPKPKK